MENYPHRWTCLEDGCLDAFAEGDGLWTEGLQLGQPVANSAGGVGTTTLYPSAAAFRSVLWLGLIEGGMSHQLAFIYGPYGEAAGAHATYTSQIGEFGRELSNLLPAIHRSVASSEPPNPRTTVTGLPPGHWGSPSPSLGWRSKAWRLATVADNRNNLTIHVVVVNLSPTPWNFTLAVDASELLEGQWVAMRRVGDVIQHTALDQGVLGGEMLEGNSTAVYAIEARAELS